MDWNELQRLFRAACDMAPDERSDFLLRECPDPEVRTKVVSLVEESEMGAGDFLRGLIGEQAAQVLGSPSAIRPGDHLGPYEIVRELGAGGMGQVFLARRVDQEFDKQVAIKVVSRGLGLVEVFQRFRQERQILASLEHPNIARLLDGGSTRDGLPYIVMEYVDGIPITDYCDQKDLGADDRCALMIHVCAAVEHAHRNLVVHRDIKPSNVLVTPDGVPKLLDFGIAKLLDPAQPQAGNVTTIFHRPLTPDYASPEQVSGERITTATDVYLLGGVLYHLLGGRKPHQISSYTSGEIERAICHTPLVKPSEVKPAWRRKLKGDLDNIVLTAMHADPARRYGSAEQLRDDLRRYLDGRPVSARADTLHYRMAKWVRRSPTAAAALVLLTVSIVAGVAGTVYQAHRAQRRFDQVRQLANAFVFDVHDEIAALPGATAARKKIVSTALTYLKTLSEESGHDPQLKLEIAAAYHKIGDVQGAPGGSNLGDPVGAMQSYQGARALLESVGPSGRKALLPVYLRMAQVQQSQGDLKSAMATCGLLRRTADELLAAEPDNAEVLDSAGEASMTLARMLSSMGQPADSDQAAQTSMKIAERLVAKKPGDPNTQLSLGAAISASAIAKVALGDLEGGAELLRRSVDVKNQALRSDPENVVYRRQVMIANGHLGEMLGYRFGENIGDLDGARKAFEEAVRTAEWLRQKDPADEKAKLDIAAAKLRLGSVLIDSGQTDAGLQLLKESTEANAAVLEKNPNHANARANSIALKFRSARALLSKGQVQPAERMLREARAEAEQVLGRNPKDAFTKSMLIQVSICLGSALASQGKAAEAEQLAATSFDALKANPRLYSAGWARARIHRDLADLHLLLSKISSRRDEHVERARECRQISQELWSKLKGGPALMRLRDRELRETTPIVATTGHR